MICRVLALLMNVAPLHAPHLELEAQAGALTGVVSQATHDVLRDLIEQRVVLANQESLKAAELGVFPTCKSSSVCCSI